MIFKYKAFKSRDIIKGKIEADNFDEAILKLKSKGLRPIKVDEDIENYSVFKKKYNHRELYVLFKELSFLLKSGVKIDTSFNLLKNQFTKDKKSAIEMINEELLKGESLKDAFKHTNMFSNFTLNLIEVGENSSNLEMIFEKLSQYYFEVENFKKKLIGALSYPILY